MEQWSKIRGFDGYKGVLDWEVSDTGFLRLFGKPYHPSTDSQGYKYFCFCAGGELVRLHRVVLFTFVGPPPKGWIATHINKDRSDNTVDNLHWVQRREIILKKRKKPERHEHFRAWLATKV